MRPVGTALVLRVLVLLAVATGLAAPAACLAAGGRVAPSNPAFLRYLKDHGSPSATRLGLTPAPLSFAGVPRGHLAPLTALFPERYADRTGTEGQLSGETTGPPQTFDLGLGGRLSPVRDQGFYGTCWAFSSLASLESGMLPDRARDFSENNVVQRSGFGLGYDCGGNSSIAAAYLLRWDGPVNEVDDPYAPCAATPNPSPAWAAVHTHVTEVLELPGRASARDNADLKWAVMTYGAVYTTMYWQNCDYRESTAAYCSSRTGVNHAVDVVGWDDAYPASRFASAPAGPGAFLVRNSWGQEFGQDGYFWISYYDDSFGRQNTVFSGSEPAKASQRVYQHDPFGWDASYCPPGTADPSTAWFAAVYTPAEDGSLTASGFYATAPGAAYEVRVADSVAAVRGARVAASGTLAVAGYHTVKLGAPVALTAGRQVVIAVRLTTPDYGFPVAIERPIPWYADATSAAGQSYVSADGATWTDMTSLVTRADVCLKGYGYSGAAVADPAADAKPTLSVTGRAGAAGSVVRVAYRVKYPDAGRRADVRFTLRTRRGGVVLRRTLRAVSVTAGHRWRLRVPARRGAYVVTAVATLDTGEVSRTATAVLRVR